MWVLNEISKQTNQFQDQSADALAALDHLLIVNDTPKVVRHFKKIKTKGDTIRRIDIVLDNAGMELVSDMIFAEFLIASDMVDQVVFHMKVRALLLFISCFQRIPWFVSDVTQEDWDYTVEAIKKFGDLGGGFGRQMERRVEDQTVVLQDHLFWTSPHRYCEMKETAPDLHEVKNSILILKTLSRIFQSLDC